MDQNKEDVGLPVGRFGNVSFQLKGYVSRKCVCYDSGTPVHSPSQVIDEHASGRSAESQPEVKESTFMEGNAVTPNPYSKLLLHMRKSTMFHRMLSTSFCKDSCRSPLIYVKPTRSECRQSALSAEIQLI